MRYSMNRVLVITALMYACTVFGAEENFQDSVPPPAPEKAAGTDPATALQQQRSIEKYQRLITDLESKHGVYDSAIGEAQLSLGEIYRQQGKYQKALAAFKQALQINRVNEGLHNLNQISIIELIIDSNYALRDWEKLNENYRYLYWVYRRNYGDGDNSLLPVIERIGRWHLKASYFTTAGTSLGHLVKADDLYDSAVEIATRNDGDKDKALINALYHTAVIDYLIATDIQDKFKFSYKDIREAMIPNGRSTPYMNEIAVREYYFNQSFFKGKRAIERILDIYAEDQPSSVIDYAQALIFYGDYLLALRRKFDAMKRYRQAYDVLVKNDADLDEINELLGEPKPLKNLNPPGDDEPDIAANMAYVDAVFDVPGNGWPNNIRIINSNPQDPKMQRRGELAIAGTRYRPRFEGGKPVATSGVKLRYVFNQ